MPTNRTAQTIADEIAQIKTVLSSGVTMSSVDGNTTQIDLDALRKRLFELEREEAGLPARPSFLGQVTFK